MAYEEEDTCMSYDEENTCMAYEEEDTCMSYEEEDTCMTYEERIHACHMRRRIHTCTAKHSVKRDLLYYQKRPTIVYLHSEVPALPPEEFRAAGGTPMRHIPIYR